MSQCDQGLVMAFFLGSFAVVVGATDRVEADGGERGEEQGAFEPFVA